MKKVLKALAGVIGIGALSYIAYRRKEKVREKKFEDSIDCMNHELEKSLIAFRKFLQVNSFNENLFKTNCSAPTPIYTFKNSAPVNDKNICPDEFVAPDGYVMLKVNDSSGNTVYALADKIDLSFDESIFANYHVYFYFVDNATWDKLYSKIDD